MHRYRELYKLLTMSLLLHGDHVWQLGISRFFSTINSKSKTNICNQFSLEQVTSFALWVRKVQIATWERIMRVNVSPFYSKQRRPFLTRWKKCAHCYNRNYFLNTKDNSLKFFLRSYKQHYNKHSYKGISMQF